MKARKIQQVMSCLQSEEYHTRASGNRAAQKLATATTFLTELEIMRCKI